MAILTKAAFTGTVQALLLNPDRDTGLEKHRVDRIELTFDGIEGDCHASRTMTSDSRMITQYKRDTEVANTRQLSILSVEELHDIARAMDVPSIEPEWAGANLVTSGIPDLTLLPPATRLMFPSGACLIIDLENAPCRYVSDVIDKHHPGRGSKFVAAAQHKRGLVAWVECPGPVNLQDEIVLHLPPQRTYDPAHGKSHAA